MKPCSCGFKAVFNPLLQFMLRKRIKEYVKKSKISVINIGILSWKYNQSG